MLISDYLKKECIIVDIKSKNKEDIIKELAELLFEHYPDIDRTETMKGIIDREAVMSTGIGEGIAIPHARIQSYNEVCMAFGLLRDGVDFNSLDGKLVKIVILILFPEEKVNLQLRTLAMVSRILQRGGLNDSLLRVETPNEVLDIFKKYEEQKHY